MFTGLSAFPLTPVTTSGVDEKGFSHILSRLTEARVDSMGILGSTGSYAYLTREQRKRIAILATQHAGEIPVMVCVGAVSTEAILHLSDDAQAAGANALLLPAFSYQPLRDEEVFALFETVTRHASVPVCIYDNPGTTHFTLRMNCTVVYPHWRGFARSSSLVSRIARLQRESGSRHYVNTCVLA
ncbi:putative 2-keto-3-deoxy-galactonate aldolase YagE [Citrobacter cronae]